MSKISRRNFVTNTSFGAAAVGLTSFTRQKNLTEEKQHGDPRDVYIASLTMDKIRGNNIEQVIQSALKQMEIALPNSPDIYCLPEFFHEAGIQGDKPPMSLISENGSGNIIAPFQAFSKKNRCYIICPIYTAEDGKYYNAAVIIDRQGHYLGEYRKVRLTEGELNRGMTPGPLDVPVFKLDFGVIGIQICFDLEWPEGWIQLQQKGAEVVFFPSAFSGGKRINSKAMDHRYYVVTSTHSGTTKICDVTGEIATSGGHSSTRWGIVDHINLEREILHTHSAGKVYTKFPDIIKKYGRKIRIHTLGEEHYTIIESLSSDIKIADIMEEFDVRSYKRHLQITDELKFKFGFENY